MTKVRSIECEDYVRMRLHGPDGLEEALWLWLWREGFFRMPMAWEIVVLKEAMGLAFIELIQHVVDRLRQYWGNERNCHD